jgi:hypothetical protein
MSNFFNFDDNVQTVCDESTFFTSGGTNEATRVSEENTPNLTQQNFNLSCENQVEILCID